MKNFFLGILFTLATLAIGGFLYLRLGLAEVRGGMSHHPVSKAISCIALCTLPCAATPLYFPILSLLPTS